MSRMGVNRSRVFVLFSVYQSLFVDAAGLQGCLHCTSHDSAFTDSWCFVDDLCAGGAERAPLSHRGVPHSSGDR